jgi:hypothetical protein
MHAMPRRPAPRGIVPGRPVAVAETAPLGGGGRRMLLPDGAKLQDDHAMNTLAVHHVGELTAARIPSSVRAGPVRG